MIFSYLGRLIFGDGGDNALIVDPPGNGYLSGLNNDPVAALSPVRGLDSAIKSGIVANLGLNSALDSSGCGLILRLTLSPSVALSKIESDLGLISELNNEDIALLSHIENTGIGLNGS